MQQIWLQADIGHDWNNINLLLSKHKTLETEILGHESTLQFSMSGGDELIQQGHFGSEKIMKTLTDAVDKENKIGNFDQYDAYEVPYEGQNVLGTHFVMAEKHDGTVKARFVVKEF